MKLRRIAAVAAALMLLAVASAPARAAQGDYGMPYAIEVDISSQIVTIYDAATGGIARQMICSTGRNNYTPEGNFVLPGKARRTDRKPWYYIDMYDRYVKYPTRIRGEILFHSVPYLRRSLLSVDAKAVAELGTPASHGCIRLRWQDAEFIAMNCLPGTRVKIHRSGESNEALRELLLQESYDAATGMPYEGFLGVSTQEGVLGRSSEGPEVLDLQYRLRDLGLYAGGLSGVYDSATVNAVRVAQYLMQRDANGVATPDFLQAIYAADAPTAMNVRLTEGMSGPAVRVLQDNLAALRLYDGPSDSVYDAEVVGAVKRFQRAYCCDADGESPPPLQKAVAYEAARLLRQFPEGGYGCEWVAESLSLGRVSAKAGIRLREAPSQKSRSLKKLSFGAPVIVLERGEGWSRVRSGADVGYVKNSLVGFREQEIGALRYAGQDGRVYVVGNTAEDYRAGAGLPWEVFAEYLAANDRQVDPGSLVNYVTVDTRGEGAALNLRSAPNAGADIVDSVENGMSLRVRTRYVEWTQVAYRGREGYLLNRYLNFWTGPEDALDPAEDGDRIDASMIEYALVKSASDERAGMYDDGADDARLLGRLPDGTRVDVLDIADGWCQISCRGRTGYMIAEDLQLTLVGDAPASEGADEPGAPEELLSEVLLE